MEQQLRQNGAGGQSGGLRQLVHLLPYARPYLWHFLFILVLVVVFNASSVLQPYLVKVAIDTDIRLNDLRGLQWITLSYVGVVFIGGIANYVQMLTLQYAGQRIIRSIRLDLFSHIESQSMAYFDNNAVGRLVTHVSSDTETVSQFFTQFFLSMVRDGLSLVMIVIAMFRLDVRIAAYSMVLIPIVFFVSIVFRRRLRVSYQTTRTRLSNVVAFLAENLAGIRIIQIFHQQRRQARSFDRLNVSHRRANVDAYGTSVLFNRILELIGNLAVAAMVWVGGGAVLRHAVLFGTLYAFISYIRQFFGPINSLTQQWNNLQSSMVAADRIGQVLNVVPATRDPAQPVLLEKILPVQGRVEFRNVSFSYKAGEPVLHGISFSVEPGSFVGFVGATGAGKSSVMSLLARFYDPDEGHIALDGIDIRQFRQADLHKVIGLVQQDVHLFTGTVLENIRMFRDDITDEMAIRAAQTVGAHELIMRLPDGYQTRIYAKGSNLAMGERQLISFARIVALDPKVLILDEATANLDSQTESLVQSGLSAVSVSRTTLVIAHRLSTIRSADQIIVLDRGDIVERGTHEELVNAGGLYADLNAKSGIAHKLEKSVYANP